MSVTVNLALHFIVTSLFYHNAVAKVTVVDHRDENDGSHRVTQGGETPPPVSSPVAHRLTTRTSSSIADYADAF